jgi:membrane associated rhomboid family serine protease
VLIPLAVDVPMYRYPYANFAIVGLTVAAFFMVSDHPDTMVLGRGSAVGWLGHLFSHAGWLHLIGNMIFLWVFGNAVCAKVGNIQYLIMYFLLGLIAALAHTIGSSMPAIGASGAVNGVIGLFLIFYPRNDVKCFYFIFIGLIGTILISSYWVILFWMGFDIYGAMKGGGGVAYWAHLGGLFGGVAFGLLSLAVGLVWMHPLEESLPQAMTRKYGIPFPVHIEGEAADAGDAAHTGETPPDSGVDLPPPPEPEAGESERVMLRCDCGQKLLVAATVRGRKIRCPTCQKVVNVPA